MRWSIAAGDAATIETELHIKILNADVVNDLIERALKKSRVDRADRFQSFARKTSGKGHTVLFRDADIEGSIRKSHQRVAHARAVRHGRCQRHDLFILGHQFAEGFAENLRVGRRAG